MILQNHQRVKDLLEIKREASAIVEKQQTWHLLLRIQASPLLNCLLTCLNFGKIRIVILKFLDKFCTGEDSSSEHESVESGDLETSQEPYVLSRRSYLSEFQKEKVDALIQEIQPETTAFVAIMRKSNVQLPTPFLVIYCYFLFNWQLNALFIACWILNQCTCVVNISIFIQRTCF